MPAEIADSDAESDFEVPLQPPSAPGLASALPPPDASPVISVNFDEFISQSQKQSPEVGRSNDVARQGTGSTEKLLRGISEAQRVLGSSSGAKDGDQSDGGTASDRKRRHTTLDQGPSMVQDGEGAGHDRRKRPRTSAETTATNARTRSDDGENADEDVIPRQRNRPRRVISLLNESNTVSTNMISTTRSSVGMYESINLDFRGSGYGLDIDQNPFGSVSQVSADGEVNLEDQQRLAQIFGNTGDLSSTLPLTTSDDGGGPYGEGGNRAEFNDFHVTADPEPSETIDPSVLPRADTNVRSRSRKSRLPSTSPFPEDQEEMVSANKENEPPRAPCEARSGNSRASTVEDENQAPEEIPETAGPAGKKRGRKPSKKPSEETHETSKVDPTSPVKRLTSETSLSDEAFVGLPIEQYKPRPSRSRSKRAVEEDATAVQKEATPAADQPPAKETKTDMSPPKSTKRGRKSKVRRAKTSAAALLRKSDPMISDGEEDVVWMETKPAKVKLDIPPDLGPHKAVKDEQAETAEAKMTTAGAGDADQEAEQNSEKADEERSEVVKQILSVEIPRPSSQPPAVEPKKRGRKRKETLDPQTDDEATAEAVEVQERPSELDDVPSQRITRPASAVMEVQPIQQQPSSVDNQPTTLDALQDKENINPTATTPSPTKSPAQANSTTGAARPKHSPINPAGGRSTYRVGLSRRTAIPSLLKVVRPVKPKATSKVEGEFKVIRLEGEERALLDD